jgi:hypothetical protein
VVLVLLLTYADCTRDAEGPSRLLLLRVALPKPRDAVHLALSDSGAFFSAVSLACTIELNRFSHLRLDGLHARLRLPAELLHVRQALTAAVARCRPATLPASLRVSTVCEDVCAAVAEEFVRCCCRPSQVCERMVCVIGEEATAAASRAGGLH